MSYLKRARAKERAAARRASAGPRFSSAEEALAVLTAEHGTAGFMHYNEPGEPPSQILMTDCTTVGYDNGASLHNSRDVTLVRHRFVGPRTGVQLRGGARVDVLDSTHEAPS